MFSVPSEFAVGALASETLPSPESSSLDNSLADGRDAFACVGAGVGGSVGSNVGACVGIGVSIGGVVGMDVSVGGAVAVTCEIVTDGVVLADDAALLPQAAVTKRMHMIDK